MKKANLIAKLASFLMFMFILGSCEKEVIKEVEVEVEAVTYTISGNVTYPDFSGNAVAANGAVVYLKIGATAATTSYDVATVADASGNYTFTGLASGSNFVYANYDTENQNNPAGRVGGAVFVGEGALVVIEEANVTQSFALASIGQDDAFAVDTYAGGDWGSDWSHSNIDFSFPYDSDNATYTGSFKLTETYVKFDPFDLGSSTIEATIDVLSVDTDAAGGRDPLWADENALATDIDGNYTNLGCISRTLGASDNSTGVHLIVDAKRYSTFVSTSIEAYGDGYLATGNFTLNGVTAPVKMFFKFLPGFEGANRSGDPILYSSFEGTFDFAATQVFGVSSGHIGENDMVTIDISYQVTKAL